MGRLDLNRLVVLLRAFLLPASVWIQRPMQRELPLRHPSVPLAPLYGGSG